MVEIAGIPRKDNENVLDLVAKLAVTAKVNDFDKAQIDVAHRTSNKANAPIIMFNKKMIETIFTNKKRNLFQLNPKILLL